MLEFEGFAAGFVFADDVGADNVARHQVGGELDARELQVQHVRHGLHQLGFAHAGDPLQQHVAARKQASHHPGNNLVVTDDDPRNLIADKLELIAEGLDLAVDDGIHFFSLSCRFRK